MVKLNTNNVSKLSQFYRQIYEENYQLQKATSALWRNKMAQIWRHNGK